MRIFSLLAIIIVLAIVMLQYRNTIKSVTRTELGEPRPEAVKKQIESDLLDYQKKLDEALNANE